LEQFQQQIGIDINTVDQCAALISLEKRAIKLVILWSW